MTAGDSRRNFLAALGSAAAWPLVARAQQREPKRRIGVLLNLAENDPETRARVAALLQTLHELGWDDGGNLQIDYRWGVGDGARHRANVTELVLLKPDLIFVHGTPILTLLQQATRTVPVVFVSVADPLASGFVASLNRPGGNATGFANFEYAMAGKWLELLKQVAPSITRAAVIRDPSQVSGAGMMGAIEAVSPFLRMDVSPVDVRDRGEIERQLVAFARQPNGGLVVTATALAQIHRDLIIALAARFRLPAIYPYSLFVTDGGLISYGLDTIDLYHRAAEYIDRILKGEKPADLPVQAPVKYETVVNLKTAKTLALDVPRSTLVRADKVIE